MCFFPFFCILSFPISLHSLLCVLWFAASFNFFPPLLPHMTTSLLTFLFVALFFKSFLQFFYSFYFCRSIHFIFLAFLFYFVAYFLFGNSLSLLFSFLLVFASLALTPFCFIYRFCVLANIVIPSFSLSSLYICIRRPLWQVHPSREICSS